MVLGWGRLFFLKNLAKFGSNASKSIHNELPATKARAYSWGFLFQRTLHN